MVNAFPELARPISRRQVRDELAGVCALADINSFRLVFSDEVTREHKRNPRRYAQVMPWTQPPVFEFADQVRLLQWEHRLGLYAHEVGHVLAGRNGEHTEDEADIAAMEVLDLIILYDQRWPGKGLQTAVR